MSLVKTLILLIALSHANALRNYSTTRSLPFYYSRNSHDYHKTVYEVRVADKPAQDSKNLVYAACTRTIPYDARATAKHCTIHSERIGASCNVTLAGANDGDPLRVYPLDKHRALLVVASSIEWLSNVWLESYLVDLWDCEVSEISKRLVANGYAPLDRTYVALQRYGFDLIFPYDDLLYRASFDSSGAQLSGPTFLLDVRGVGNDPASDLVILPAVSSDGGSLLKYLLIRDTREDRQFSLIDQNGAEKALISFRAEPGGIRTGYSLSTDRIDIVGVAGYNLVRMQFDLSGNVTLYSSARFRHSYGIVAMQRLADEHDGFMLLCSNRKYEGYANYYYSVLEYDKHSREVGHLELSSLRCNESDWIKWPKMIELDDGVHCVVLTCFNRYGKLQGESADSVYYRIKLDSVCFGRDDFVKRKRMIGERERG